MGEVNFQSVKINEMMHWKKDFGEKNAEISSEIKCKTHRQILGELFFFNSIKGDN